MTLQTPSSFAATRAIRRGLAAVGLLTLAACSSLPTIVPDMARSPGPVQLEGANGPLSRERSKSILAKLAASGQATSIFDRHLALEGAIGSSPLVAGNTVVLLQDGPSTYKAMFAAIDAARDHIDMETYILEDDDVGKKFAATLIAKQQAGVQVNLIHDSVGTLGTPKAFFQALIDAGVKVLEFNPINPLTAKAGWDVNQRDHRKLLVVDGKIAILGGINISSVYSGGSASQHTEKRPASGLPWRDTDLQITGPVVAEFQKLFMQTWEKQKGEPLPPRNYFPPLASTGGKSVVRAIGSSPDEPYSLIYATLISALRSAETEILLTNAYFVPDPQLIAALEGAVARGVDVKLILPSRTDSWLVFSAGRAHYDQLLRGGVKIFERQEALLHAKTAVIDGVWSTVGSTNLDWRSFLHNQEINAVVLGGDFGDEMRAAFKKDLANSKPVTLEEWERRPVDMRLKEALARMWEYWL
ncbi:phospholipase D-like domain-containing protein [soil metagenome]